MKYHVIRVIRSKNVFSVVFNCLMIILREKKKNSFREKRRETIDISRLDLEPGLKPVLLARRSCPPRWPWHENRPIPFLLARLGRGLKPLSLHRGPRRFLSKQCDPSPLPLSPPRSRRLRRISETAGLEREGRGSRKWRAPLTKKELLLSSFRASLSKHRSPINARKALWEREREKDLTSLLNKEESQDIDSNEL